MKYKAVITGIALFAVAGFAYAEKPNVIFVYGDDIGYGDFSCYGGEVDTYNIDRLAEAGVRFTGGYCAAATCTPSRYSLLTGEYAFRNKGCTSRPEALPNVAVSAFGTR